MSHKLYAFLETITFSLSQILLKSFKAQTSEIYNILIKQQ